MVAPATALGDLHTAARSRWLDRDNSASLLDFNSMEAAMDPSRPSDSPPSTKGKGMGTKPPDAGVEDDETEHDESKDTSSRTSTRLVKFQLFETKAVASTVYSKLILALLYSWIEPERNS